MGTNGVASAPPNPIGPDLRLVQEPRSLRNIHFPALDGVRLLAVALVILHHVTSGSRATFLLHLAGMQHGNGVGRLCSSSSSPALC